MFDAFGLQKVPALVAGNNFEAGTDAEANAWHERIGETDAVHIAVAGAKDEVTQGVVAAPEFFEDL